MSNDIRWARLSSACGPITLASLLRRNRNDAKQAHKAELNEWENEGGSVAPSLAATVTLVVAGQPEHLVI
jgi:hypothetical protein